MLGSGAVTLVQRFGSALNLNLHLHMLYLNGVYDDKGYFWPVRPPTPEDLDRITYAIAKRIARYLERARYLFRDAESEHLDLVPEEEGVMHDIIGASIISVQQSDISLKPTKSHRELEPNSVLRGLCAWLMKQKWGKIRLIPPCANTLMDVFRIGLRHTHLSEELATR
ncbi:MAG: hypothetical protein HN432_05390 [Gammaproteobacteria bacterium]|jgi:hypothetical protein|nr:hypothetical protein [Gammaproteobacteria bacterium]